VFHLAAFHTPEQQARAARSHPHLSIPKSPKLSVIPVLYYVQSSTARPAPLFFFFFFLPGRFLFPPFPPFYFSIRVPGNHLLPRLSFPRSGAARCFGLLPLPSLGDIHYLRSPPKGKRKTSSRSLRRPSSHPPCHWRIQGRFPIR